MSRPEPTSDSQEVQDPKSGQEGAEVVMYMEASGPGDCAEGWYWDGEKCVKIQEETGTGV